jgi:hypothetical protein
MPNLDSFSKLLTLLISVVVVVSLWAISASGQAQLTERSKLAINGIGPIRIGMTVNEASRSAVLRLIKTLSDGRPQEHCAYFDPQGGPKGISFMVINGRIARVDISNERVTTVSGIKIGDPEAKILKLYPPQQIQVASNRRKTITYIPRDAEDRNYRLIFSINGSRVSRFRSGRLPEVEYMDGCA